MLKNLTQTFKDNCNAREVILSEYVILDNIQIPVKAELNDDCYNEGNFVGTFIFKELRFETSNEYDFKKKEFEYYKVVNGESVKIGTFITTEITDNDTEETIKVVAMDYGLKTQVEYTSELNYGAGNVTLLDVWNENCEMSGLESGITSFTNSSFIVDSDQFSGTGATRRDVFIAIAQSSCDFVKIGNDDKIYLILKEETNEIIEEYTNLEDKRDTQPINAVSLGMSQVEGENVTKIADGVSEKNANWLVINDNPFAYTQEKRNQLINGIFNKINGFGYSAFKTETSFKPYLTCGDLVKFKRKDGVLVDSIILRYKHNFDNITLEAPSITKTTVNYVRPESAIDIVKRTEFIVDKQNQKIEAVASEVGQYDNRITSVEQSVEGLTTQVSQITIPIRDITGNNSIIFENASNTTISKLSIHGDISLLFGNDGEQYGEPAFFSDDLYFNDNQYFSNGVPYAEILYPSNTLFGKNMNLVIEYSDSDIEKIKLPFTYLNYINSEIYDEFKIENGKASVIRRVGINSNMEKYQLEAEVIEDLGDFSILLKEGNPKMYLQCFDSAIYNASYMVKNDYTDIFATKIELNSSITQTKDEINLEVSKKVDENEVISSINLTSEDAKINAKKITLEGIVTANENFKVLEDGSIEAVNGNFSGDVYLGDGGKVIGGDGILSVMIVNASIWSLNFLGGQGFMPLGFDAVNNNGVAQSQMIEFIIPSSFKPQKAFIYLKHKPITHKGYFSGGSSEESYVGYSRNIKAYICSDNSFGRVISYSNSAPEITGNYNEIPSCFGDNGFTGSASGLTQATSFDISDYIKNPGTYSIRLKSSATASGFQNIYESTGGILAQLYIFGYENENIN